MAERVRFPGDPEIRETGTGQGPDIPLPKTVAPTSVEMLNQSDDEDHAQTASRKGKVRSGRKPVDVEPDEEDDDADEGGPSYQRENIGARVGLPLEESQKALAIAEALDKDDVVACLFPREVRLQDAGIMHVWAPGTHMVPVAIAGRTPKERHWWLKHHRVKHVGKPMKNPNADETNNLVEDDEDAA